MTDEEKWKAESLAAQVKAQQEIIDRHQRERGISNGGIRVEDILGTRPVGTDKDSGGGGVKITDGSEVSPQGAGGGVKGVVAALNENRGPGPKLEDPQYDAAAYAVRSKLSQEHRDHTAARWAMLSAVAAVIVFVILMALPFLKRQAAKAALQPTPARKVVVVSPIPVQVTPPKEFAGDSLLVGNKIYHGSVRDVGKPTDPIESPDAGSAARLYVRSLGEKQMIGTFVIQARNAPDQPWMSVGAVVNPPVTTWQKLGGPIFPFMRFELTNMAQGDGVEVDLCSGECPDKHDVWVQK